MYTGVRISVSRSVGIYISSGSVIGATGEVESVYD